jgi:hypothetical protein
MVLKPCRAAHGIEGAFPLALPVRWLIAVLAVLAASGQAGTSSRDCASARCSIMVSCRCHRVSASEAGGSSRHGPTLTGDCARFPRNARLDQPRMRCRRPAPGHFPSAVSVAGNSRLQLSECSVIVAPREAVQPLIFLLAERTRGPPWLGAQRPRLFDGARDRPAPPLCATPPPSGFYFPSLSSVPNASAVPRHGAPAHLAMLAASKCGRRPIKHSPHVPSKAAKQRKRKLP